MRALRRMKGVKNQVTIDLFPGAARSSATISDCGKFRYDLVREWDPGFPVVLFVMLNPSTADHEKDDPTVRRCLGFAKDWGFGTLVVCNLFAFRATDPRKLRDQWDPVGPANDRAIVAHAEMADEIVCAWGNNGSLWEQSASVKELLSSLSVKCLGLTKNGQPKHPLRLKKTTQRQAF